MCILQFKIVFPPVQSNISNNKLKDRIDEYLESFKENAERHSIIIETFEFLRFSKGGGNVPHFTEIEISATAEYIGSSKKLDAYERLRKVWVRIMQNWTNSSRKCQYLPLLMLFDSEAFHHTNQLVHKKIEVKDVRIGIMPFPSEFMSFVKTNEPDDGLLCSVVNFLHDEKKIQIPLRCWINDVIDLVVLYKNIRKIVVDFGDCTKNSRKNSTVDLYLDLLHPPIVLKFKPLDNESQTVQHSQQCLEEDKLTSFIIGRSNILKLTFKNYESAIDIISRLRFCCFSLPVYYGNITQIFRPKRIGDYVDDPAIDLKSFSCQYLLTAIFQRNFTYSEQCVRLSLDMFRQLSEITRDSKAMEKALLDILFAVDSGYWIYFPHAFSSLSIYYSKRANNADENSNHYIVPEKTRFIRRVTVTPTRKLLWPPEIMFENRILRNYDPDFALRVIFRNDDMSPLSWNKKEQRIYDAAVRKPMTKGIRIGKRTFKFLGWSGSQIREHGAWYYAKNNSGNGVYHIRRWMGDFSHIKSVSKYMARLGQSFSQTEASVSVPLRSKSVRFENDITGGWDFTAGKPYCFSDGVGKISLQLAKKVQHALGHDKNCSAFQIRYGGCKGMLVIDPTLKDADLVFRDSMKKFESPGNIQLEIAKASAPVSLQLNRPFITILDQMGVSPRIFLQLQEEYLRQLTDILLDEQKAANYLKANTPLASIKFNVLSKSGIELTTEPFFRSLLITLHKCHVDKIKTHANISIDPSEGRSMLGVLDETNTLEYGQVFVQYTKDMSQGETTMDTQILTDTVLVTKNPCMHPGDVRKFTAVDVPALHHIRDCIVFPQNSQRPHPNEMAGSDLDGDEYSVLWKKELIFSGPNVRPAEYPSSTAPAKDIILEKDIVDFMVEYIKNDNIGVMANAHLAQADQLGIHHRICLEIAAKFSIAIDYAKSGSKMTLNEDERPDRYPDFMEKSHKITYKSKRALGKLFRVCKDFEGINLLENLKAPIVQIDPDLVYPDWEKYENSAIKSRNKYNRLLCYILQTYGVQNEAEAFSGAFTRLHCRFHERKDKAEVSKIVTASICALFANMNKEFYCDIQDNINDPLMGYYQKASAWYMVTYREPDAPYLSFPWIVSDFLANMKLRKSPKVPYHVHTPIINRIESMIQEKKDQILGLSPKTIKELENWNYLCKKSVVALALRVMLLWAHDSCIIQEKNGFSKGFLNRSTFVALFLHIAEKEQYVVSLTQQEMQYPVSKSEKSAAALCIAFLRFCVTLRFYNKEEVKQFLPFKECKYKDLSKYAMFTYHEISVTGTFRVLQFDTANKHDLIEMKPEYIDSSIFGASPIPLEHLQKLEKKLVEITNAHQVSLREICNINKVLVSAVGEQKSLCLLKRCLSKDKAILGAML